MSVEEQARAHFGRTPDRELIDRLREAGFIAYHAGGSVRDRLLGRESKDIDIATSASPDQVLELFENTRELGKAFGVVQVILDGIEFEVATFRRDLEYTDGRRPEGVEPSTPEEDAERRDFTINGLFYDPVADEIIDFVDGRADLDAKVIRAIGDPSERFREDRLRLLRAVRFATVLGFDIEPKTWAAIQEHAAAVTQVSPERIRIELNRILLEAPQAGKAFWMLLQSGLLAAVLPEAIPMVGQEQPPQFHPEGDVFTHTCLMLDLMPPPGPERTLHLAWSIVFHDISKPETATTTIEADGSERIRFNGHETKGAEVARNICGRLKFSKADTDAIGTVVRNHMRYGQVDKMRKNTLRKLIGAPYYATEIELHRIDCLGCHGHLENYEFMKAFEEALGNEPVLPDPLVTGRDLIDLGVKAGPGLGAWKQKAFDRQLEDDDVTREDLLAWLAGEVGQAND